MKPRRKLTAIVMAAAMMLTMVPSAFAAETDVSSARPAPDGVLEGTTAPANNTYGINAITDNGLEGAGTQENPYLIQDEDDFQTLMDDSRSTSGMTYDYYRITADLDLDEVIEPSQWMGYLMYFRGEIEGAVPDGNGGTRPAVISGMNGDTYLIYGWFGGALKNLEFDLEGKAATINYICGKLDNKYQNCLMQNIDVTSDTTVILGSDAQANYAPFTYSMYGNFTLDNCVNYADISGGTYASVFVGYYPLDHQTGHYTFKDCVNKGDISLKHAGMFFGNNSLFVGQNKDYYAFDKDNVENNVIQFENCKNEGAITGTNSAYVFSGRPAGEDSISDAYESYLTTTSSAFQNVNGGSVGCISSLNMALTYDAQGNLEMTPANNSTTPVDHYVVSVYTYVNSYAMDNDGDFIYNGTDRYGTSQEIAASASDKTIQVKYFGVCDYPAYDEGITFVGAINGVDIVEYENQKYYWVDNDESYIQTSEYGYYYYVKSPDEGSGKIDNPSIATLSAYAADGTLLGVVSAEPEV